MTDEGLRELCEEFGEVVSTKAIIDKETNQCRGYGFVDFKEPKSAKVQCIT
jgi:RNA recognition motif-containing protein